MYFFHRRPPPPPGYDAQKAAQIAAFFLLRAGGSSEILKLAKLLYLAERASYERYGEPLTGDQLCSMEHGPVLSETLNFVRNEGEPPDVWRDLITERVGNDVGLHRAELRAEDLTRLSDADIELLDEVWRQVGHMTGMQLRRWTHEHCPEYDANVGKSSRPIRIDDLLRHLHYEPEQARQIKDESEERDRFRAALKRAEA